ncbi:hypothetical protein Taro_018218 [Colocasia esculenta]|uniref:Uncharacterized protein n=1 Tax=Colocasia esculenta TaxID=4460 RepID=A0A843UVM4_COLES|nr:hypothetical protein [Colocasia esculenta]
MLSVQEFEMADRRDWGGGGDEPEESTQRMIEMIWESLTDIRASVPPATVPPEVGGAVPVAPVPPPPSVEVPFVPFVPPPPPARAVEEPPPTYTGGPNPDTAEHWIHEIEQVL